MKAINAAVHESVVGPSRRSERRTCMSGVEVEPAVADWPSK
jgi:hypothetical protein